MMTQPIGTWFLIVSLTPAFQGCSLLGVGEAHYACQEPGKGVCKSARTIYHESSPSTALSNTQQHTSSLPRTQPEPDRTVIREQAPHRTPAQILRIWIAPLGGQTGQLAQQQFGDD